MYYGTRLGAWVPSGDLTERRWFGELLTHNMVSLILSGRHEFDRAVFSCDGCGHRQAQGFEEFIKMNAWPASPSEKELTTVIDVSVMKRWRSQKNHASPASLQSFLRQLEDESFEYGGAVRELKLFAKRILFVKRVLRGCGCVS